MQISIKVLFRSLVIIAASLLAAVFLAFLFQQYSIRILDERFDWSHQVWLMAWGVILFFCGPLLLRNLFRHAAEFISASLLAGVFIVFLLQIFFRYVLRDPLGWTLELCLILWLWIVFFGCAFIVRNRDHVTFDILYLAAPRPIRLVFAAIACLAVILGFLWAFVPTWDYIDWMKMRKTATVRNPLDGAKIPLRTIFMVYAVFLLAVVMQFGLRLVQVVTKPDDIDSESRSDAIDDDDKGQDRDASGGSSS